MIDDLLDTAIVVLMSVLVIYPASAAIMLTLKERRTRVEALRRAHVRKTAPAPRKRA